MVRHGASLVQEGEIEDAVAHAGGVLVCLHQVRFDVLGEFVTEGIGGLEEAVDAGIIAGLELVREGGVEAADLAGESE